MTSGIVGEIGKNDGGIFFRDPHRRIEFAAGANIERGEGGPQTGDRGGQSGGADRDRIFRTGKIA